MVTGTQNSAQYFTVFRVLHFAFLSGMVLFGGVAYYLTTNGSIKPVAAQIEKEIWYALIFLMASAIGGSMLFFQKKMTDIRSMHGLGKKLNAYRAARILQYAMIEIPALAAIGATLLTGDIRMLAVAAVLILFFATLMPSAGRACREMELSAAGKLVLENPEGTW